MFFRRSGELSFAGRESEGESLKSLHGDGAGDRRVWCFLPFGAFVKTDIAEKNSEENMAAQAKRDA